MNYRSLKAQSNVRAIIYTVFLIVTALGAQIGTLVAVNHISDNHRSKILHCKLKVCAFELLVWDLLI
jgi:hypothetical protein